MLSRRETLNLALAAGMGAAVAGCGRLPGVAKPSQPLTPSPRPDPHERVLARVGFGATAESREKVRAQGIKGFVEEQIEGPAETIGDRAELAFKLRHLEAFEMESAELGDQPEAEVMRQLQTASILRATYSDWGLYERMADFWTNHFNIYGRKGLSVYRLPKDQVTVIRKNALGSFPEMLRASAHSAAMLVYLDNQMNVAGVPNENYARELMELHTLGVHGGYTQADVKEVARCFTGWTVENRILRPRGRFRFDEALHDKGAKVVLGRTLYKGGQADGEEVLEILASHPKTAAFLAQKLTRFFLGDAGKPLEGAVTQAYLATKGDIRSMLRPILASEALITGPGVVRRPFDYAVACLRATGADTDAGGALQKHLESMGQPLHQWPMPDGYPDRTSSWTGSLLARWNFALALCSGNIPGTTVKPEAANMAMALAGPQFQWR